MFSRSRRRVLVIFLLFLVVFEMVAYVITTPRTHEQFFQLYVLGANGSLSEYYPNNNPDIGVGDLVRWHVGVTDFMGSVQLVVIRIKLGNQTIRPPDDLKALPSPAPLVAEFGRFIQDNETWEMPFSWQIVNADSLGSSARILGIRIGNETYQVPGITAVDGHNFRVILELWTWEPQSQTLQFGWSSANEQRVAWVQVWFNMTSPMRQ